MVAVGIVAAGLAALEHARRLKILVVNSSNRTIREVRLTHAGRQLVLGPIRPYRSAEGRIGTDLSGVGLYSSFDVNRSHGTEEQHIENAGIAQWSYGQTIRFDYNGETINTWYGDR